MLKEWLYQYNPFNSIKVLSQRERMEKCINGEFLPPVSVNVDVSNLCNVNCNWCQWVEYRKKYPQTIPDKVLLEMPQFLEEWGVKSVIVTGGGEPLVHPRIAEFLPLLKQHKLKVGLMTNALLLSNENIFDAVLKNCNWIGVSLDAGSAEIYHKIKKPKVVDAFNRIVENINKLRQARGDAKLPRITAKFIVHHTNYGELYRFVELAKILRVDNVHIRPVYLPGYKFTDGVRKTVEFYLRESRKDLEDDNFKIYGIVHKFDRDWQRIIRFKKCYATVFGGVFLANGLFGICPDRRNDPDTYLGKYYPFEELKKRWGSERHKEILERISPQACPKCSAAITNEVIERAIINEEMDLDFM